MNKEEFYKYGGIKIKCSCGKLYNSIWCNNCGFINIKNKHIILISPITLDKSLYDRNWG